MDYLGEYLGVGWQNEPSFNTPINARNLGIMEDGIKRLFDYIKSNLGNNNTINANDYGIVGDGMTDVSGRFTDLVAELSANGGGTIYLPNGDYLVKSRITWKSNVSLIGESHKAILLPYCEDTVSQGFACISWLNADGSSQGIYNEYNPMVNCHFSNFTIDGIHQNPAVYDSHPKGINIHFMKDCTFENVQFLNTFATGLGIDFLENVFIHNIYCKNCGRGYVVTSDEQIVGGAGIGIGTMGMPKESCVISDCITEGCGNYGIFLEGGSIFPSTGSQSRYIVSNCQANDGRNYGFVVKGTDNVIFSNNIATKNSRDGFALLGRPQRHCENIQFVGNISSENGGCGYRFSDADTRDHVSNNIYAFSNTALKNTKDGMLLSSLFEEVYVKNNVFKGNNRGIALADYDFVNVVFDNNEIFSNTIPYVLNGRLFNDNKNTQLINTIYPEDELWEKKIYNDKGEIVNNNESQTTVNYYYCGGSQKVGFHMPKAYVQNAEENRIAYVQWFDVDLNFISRFGSIVNNKGYALYEPPANAKYVKFRVGLNSGDLTNEVMRSVECVIYMTDKNRIIERTIPSSDGGTSFSGDAKDVEFKSTSTLKSTNVRDAIDEVFFHQNQQSLTFMNSLSEKVTRPSSAEVGQMLVVKSVGTNGKPTEFEAVNVPQGGGGSFSGSAKDVTYDNGESELESTNVQDAIMELSGQKIDHPSTGAVGQILEIESVDENGKPKTYKAVDKPQSGGEVSDEQIANAVQDYLTENPPEVGEIVPHWAEFPRLINPARDIYNSVAMTKKQVLGTDGTLRHNLMIHGDLMTWTESTGVDYADKSGAAHVKLMGFFDYFGNGHTTENLNISKTDVYDVFPSGSDILGVDGTVMDTVVASSDSTLVDTGSGNYILMAGCQGASSYHMVYREVNYKQRGTLTLGDTINVLTINGAEWDMTTLREDYHNKYSQLNTKVIKSGNYYYMTMVQGGVGIAVMKSADGKAWELHHHIPDTNCHLEACIGEVGYVSNKMPKCYIIARNNYGFGYVTLYAFKGIDNMEIVHKLYIPASSGRAMLDTVNGKDIYLTYSVNGRHNAVIAKIMPNNDGTSGVSIFETPKDTMSNYPVLFAGRSSLGSHTMWFGGTDGLNKKPSSVSFAYLWNENDDVLNAKNEQLKKVMFGTSVEVVQTLKEGTEIGSVGGTKLYAPSSTSLASVPALQLLGSMEVTEDTGSVDFNFDTPLNLKKIMVYANTKGVADYTGQARGNVFVNGKNVADGMDNTSFKEGASKYMLFDIDIHQSGTIGRMYMQNNMWGGYSSEKVAFVIGTDINSDTDITKISFTANAFYSVAIAAGTTVSVYGY